MRCEMIEFCGGVGSSVARKDKPCKSIAKDAAAVEKLSGVGSFLETAEVAWFLVAN